MSDKLTTGQRAIAFAFELIQGAARGEDFSGADVQDAAIKHGLINLTAFDPKKHHGPGSEFSEPGDAWVESSPGLKRAIAASRRAKP